MTIALDAIARAESSAVLGKWPGPVVSKVGPIATVLGTPLVVTWPAGYEADDVGVLLVYSTSNQSNTLDGWTFIGSSYTGSSTSNVRAFYRRVNGTQASVSFPVSASFCQGVIFTVAQAAATFTPVVATRQDSSDTTVISTPAISNVLPQGSLVFNVIGVAVDAVSTDTVLAPAANTSLHALVEHLDISSDVSYGGGFVLLSGSAAITGSVGSTTATAANSSRYGYVTVAFPPPGFMEASAKSVASASATGLYSSSIALSNSIPSGIAFVNGREMPRTGGALSADTINGTTALCAVPYASGGVLIGDATNVGWSNTISLVFSDGTLASFQIAQNSWMTIRAVNDTLYALVSDDIGALIFDTSVIEGYRANNSDTNIFHAGNRTSLQMPFAAQWSGLAFGNGVYVATKAAENGVWTNRYATSVDRINWTIRASNLVGAHVVFLNGLFYTGAYTSPDGETWTAAATAATPFRVSGNRLFDWDGRSTTDLVNWTIARGHQHNVAYVETAHDAFYVGAVESAAINSAFTVYDAATFTNSTRDAGQGYGYPDAGGGAVFAFRDSIGVAAFASDYYYGAPPYVSPNWWRIDAYNIPSGGSGTSGKVVARLLTATTPLNATAQAVATATNQTLLDAVLVPVLLAKYVDSWTPLGANASGLICAADKLLAVVSTNAYVSPSSTVAFSGPYSRPTTVVNPGVTLPVFVGFTGAEVYYTTSGTSWTLAYTHSAVVTRIDYINGEFIAYSVTSAAAARSSDGISWTTCTLGYPGVGFERLFYTADGRYYASVVSDVLTHKLYYTSSLTLPWDDALLANYSGILIEDVWLVGAEYVARFNADSWYRSSTGTGNWTQYAPAPVSSTRVVQRLPYADGTFLALEYRSGDNAYHLQFSSELHTWVDSGVSSPFETYGPFQVDPDGYYTLLYNYRTIRRYTLSKGATTRSRLIPSSASLAATAVAASEAFAGLANLFSFGVGQAVAGVPSAELTTQISMASAAVAVASSEAEFPKIKFDAAVGCTAGSSAAVTTAIRLTTLTGAGSYSPPYGSAVNLTVWPVYTPPAGGSVALAWVPATAPSIFMQSTTNGSLFGPLITLESVAVASAATVGALYNPVALDAVSLAGANASGELSLPIELLAVAQSSSAVVSELSTTVQLAGSVVAAAVTGSVLTTGVRLTGLAACDATPVVVLSNHIRFHAVSSATAAAQAAVSTQVLAYTQAVCVSVGSGVLTGVASQLAASAEVVGSANVALHTQIRLDGVVVADTFVTVALLTHIRLSAYGQVQAYCSTRFPPDMTITYRAFSAPADVVASVHVDDLSVYTKRKIEEVV